MTYSVELDQLAQARVRVDRIAREIQVEGAALARLTDELLDGGWSGGAAATYREGWAEWKTGANDLLEALETMAALLGQSRVSYEHVEDFSRSDYRGTAHRIRTSLGPFT